MNFNEIFGNRLLFFDGAMGTMLQKAGLCAGELPEIWNITHPEKITAVHEQYLNEGCNIILANTFGANGFKYTGEPYTVQEIVKSGVALAAAAAKKYNTPENPRFAALDLGPTGKLLKPAGTLEFEECVNIYAVAVRAGVSAGAQLIVIETMSDTLEAKAALLAAKENSSLPVLVSLTFDESGRTLSGASLESAAAMLKGLCADAIGLNCGLGPVQMRALAERLCAVSALPVFICPNAGLPVGNIEGEAQYDITPQQFASTMCEIAKMGVYALGGCCGTTPLHLRETISLCKSYAPKKPKEQSRTIVTGYANAVTIGDKPLIIGERINPTGKKRFKQALLENDLDYILAEAAAQLNCGADILDVNVGMPEIDETKMLTSAVTALQGITRVPLQLDSASPDALNSAMRVYNGKPLVNSVNGKRESMQAVFPLVKKYGGVVVGLTLDENGIPETAAERVEIAKKIINTAAEYGIDKSDIIIDTLTMTISTGAQNAIVTLDALKAINEMGVGTVLGASNISFGLPCREHINTAFLAQAIMAGLSAAIINPCSEPVLAAFKASSALCGFDEGCRAYTAMFSSAPKPEQSKGALPLYDAVLAGISKSAVLAVSELLNCGEAPMDIIENSLMPALNKVGEEFENKTLFLPQLLMSAEAANAAFAILRDKMLAGGEKAENAICVVIATVEGDIHDIGKNIVKVLLQNYGFKVIDLGKNVPPTEILNAVIKNKAAFCGLSALMTTTVGAMEKTIALIKENMPQCRTIVGGAVLTKSYAAAIGADYYAKTAMDTVRYAKGEGN